MDMRTGSAEDKIFFRSNRLIRVNRGYYFQCRGGIEYGPYSDIKTAKLMLERFVNQKKKEAEDTLSKERHLNLKRSQAESTLLDASVIASSVSFEYGDTFGTPNLRQLEKKNRSEKEAKRTENQKPHTATVTPIRPGITGEKATTEIASEAEAVETQASKKNEPKVETKIKLNKTSIEEYKLGALLGKIEIENFDNPQLLTFKLSDARFVVNQDEIALCPDEYLIFDLDPSITLEVSVIEENEEICLETFLIEVEPMA